MTLQSQCRPIQHLTLMLQPNVDSRAVRSAPELMNHNLRVLLVDDNPDDRLLALRALQRELPNLEATEITNDIELASALDQGGFDLVITDFQLRWSDGLQVVRQVKKLWP